VSQTDLVPGVPDPRAPKPAWRDWAKARRRAWAADPLRRAADEAALRAALAAWAPWRDARLALVYLAFGDEPDPLQPGSDVGPALATTRTLGPGRPLALHAWAGALERHRFGFLQPRADAPTVERDDVELVLVPGLAFDRHGGRLGHGQGHYDRLLSTLPASIPRVGVTLAELVVERLPMEAHDVAMTHLLTPAGVRAVTVEGGRARPRSSPS
jgi:5-formyltetrahydrofolate cyclo-ligase